MKHSVSELSGALLDAAVAMVLGHPWRIDDETIVYVKGRLCDPEEESAFCPSMYWDHGGPIIQRERIGLTYWGEDRTHPWSAEMPRLSYHIQPASGWADAPLIAAMRAYCASRFGDEVELP